MSKEICGVSSLSGPFGEPLACGHPKGHGGPHAWATLPTYVKGRPIFTDGKPHASLDVELVVTEIEPRRWQWEVRNIATARRVTDFGWESTERKAWVKALSVARTGFGPEVKS